MLKRIRYKIALILLKKAHELFEKGDYKSIMKGIRYTKLSFQIVPFDDQIAEVLITWATEHQILSKEYDKQNSKEE